MSGRSHYEVLGVPRTATPEQLKAAYRAAAAELHDDKLQALPARQRAVLEEEMKRLNLAYGVLSDPVKRAEYDRSGGAGELDERVLQEIQDNAGEIAVEGVRAGFRGLRRLLSKL